MLRVNSQKHPSFEIDNSTSYCSIEPFYYLSGSYSQNDYVTYVLGVPSISKQYFQAKTSKVEFHSVV